MCDAAGDTDREARLDDGSGPGDAGGHEAAVSVGWSAPDFAAPRGAVPPMFCFFFSWKCQLFNLFVVLLFY